MALSTDDTIEVLRSHLAADHASLLNTIVKDLLAAEREVKAATAKDPAAPKVKTRYQVLIRGDASLKPLVAGGAWVVTTPDDTTSDTYRGEGLLARLTKAAKTQNEAPKR